MKTTIDFQHIRATPKSRNDSFEDLAVVLFRNSSTVSSSSEFVRLRGAGGDGGVEAYFEAPDKSVYGLQAKYFFRLGSSEFGQIKSSLASALQNHPQLREYYIYIPFDLTGKVAGGTHGKSEHEKFSEWKCAEEARSAKTGQPLTIILVSAAEIIHQLLLLDVHGGMSRYWFGTSTLSSALIGRCLEEAKVFAGPRYTASLDVVTAAHQILDIFGGIEEPKTWVNQYLRPLVSEFISATKHGRADKAYSIMAPGNATAVLSAFQVIRDVLVSICMNPCDLNSVLTARSALANIAPLLEQAERLRYDEFFTKHGADKDSAGFRQWSAEYMCDFPAGDLDNVRDIVKLSASIREALNSPAVCAASAQTLLMVGPAGIGKTHALVGAASRRLNKGAWSLILFGDDFESGEPWTVVRQKLGFGSDVGRYELFECIQAAAEHTEFPFLLVIDALNESPNAASWKGKLPVFLQQIKPYPQIKLCVSTRDTYRDLVVDDRFPGYAFEHTGFAGEELQATQAFCAAFGLTAEITPLFADELTNPLFLQLACKTLRAQGKHQLDLSLPGFIQLFEDYLVLSDREIRNRLNYANPANLVRLALAGLVEEGEKASNWNLSWELAASAVKAKIGSEVSSYEFLENLRKQGLVIVARDPLVAGEAYVVRIAFQRYCDVLRAFKLIETASDKDGAFDASLFNQIAQASLSEDRGLLEATAAALPFKTGLEVIDIQFKIERGNAYTAFVNSIPWRSRESISRSTRAGVDDALGVNGVWKQVFEVFLKVGLVPDHHFNARYLHQFLLSKCMTERDPYLSHIAYESIEKKGVVESIIQAASLADVGRWPHESAALASIVLGWLSSVADRRVRDRSSKALTRVVWKNPRIAAPLLEAFQVCDDEYVKERVVLAVYSAYLLGTERKTDFVRALDVALASGYDTPNVLIRDTVRLLGSALGAGTLAKDVQTRLDSYPTRHKPIVHWPTLDDAKPILDNNQIPSNMKLKPTGMYTDFSQYVVQLRIRRFDMDGAGITYENILAWIMVQAIQAGYLEAGNGNCIVYDQQIVKEYGQGRAHQRFAERLGKKYYWIALHRLVGVLSDTVATRGDYDGTVPDANHLWSQELRDIDLTDLRNFIPVPDYPLELLGCSEYPFEDQPASDHEWVRSMKELTPHGDALLHKDARGTLWVLLEFFGAASSRGFDEDVISGSYRQVSLDYSSVFIAKSMSVPVSLGSRDLESMFESDSNSDYRGFFAEYPSRGYFARVKQKNGFLDDYVTGKYHCNFSSADLLRGGEWEYDCSAPEGAPSLTVPGSDLINELGLTWDMQSGWLVENGSLAVVWLTSEERKGLFIRKKMLDTYLLKTKQVLLWRRFVCKHRSNAGDSSSQVDIFSYVRYDGMLDVLHEKSEFF